MTAEVPDEDTAAYLTASFMQGLGVPIDQRAIMSVYSVPRDLRTHVFRLKDAQGNSAVWKVQPVTERFADEGDNFNLLADDGYKGLTLPHAQSVPINDHMILMMPYLGHCMADLKHAMHVGEEIRLGRHVFNGFTEEEIIRLTERLRADHLRFADKHHLLHDDLGLQTQANNVTCRSIEGKLRLLLVDAAKLRPASEENIEHFHDQMDLIQEWMFDNLLGYT